MISEFRVQVDGQTVEGATSPLSVVETERKFQVGVVSLFTGESPRMEGLFWLLWRSLNPDGSMNDDTEFDEWLAGLSFYELPDEDTGKLPPPSPHAVAA